MTAKQGYRAFIVAAACFALLAVCGSAAAAVRLELKLEKGKTYYERSVIDQKMTQTVMDQEQNIEHAIGLAQKLDVLDVDDKGNMRLRYTYTWTRFKQTGPMGTVDYDSSQQPTAPGGAEGFAALIGEGYLVRASPKGDVLDINGVEQFAEAVRKKLPPDTDTSSAGNPMAFLLSEDAIRETTESSLAVYPDEPVEQGASWAEKRTTRQGGLAMITDQKWTLQKRNGGVATIASISSLQPDPKAPPVDAQGMKIKIDVSGTQESTMQVDEKTGLIKTNRSHQVLKGKIGIGSAPEGPFDVMTIPVTFDTTITTEMSDRPLEK